MKIGTLLEELIKIAQTSKTDFAISMNMTPSGLSKILNGTRIPYYKEKRSFSHQAASYFAKTLYDHFCYLNFEHIFPVIYDFNSTYELEMFLFYAIEYTLDNGCEENRNWIIGYSGIEKSFLGKKHILNIFCIIVSDYITCNKGIPLEFFSNLPVSDPLYSDIFHRIKLTSHKKQIIFNHFFDMTHIEEPFTHHKNGTLTSIVNSEKYVDLNLWKITDEIDSSFLLLKGHFLLLFSIQLDGTPLMTFITQKGHVSTFFTSLMKKNVKKISYNAAEAAIALCDNASFLSKQMKKPIHAVYDSIFLGYFIEHKDLKDTENKSLLKNTIIKYFKNILTKDTVFYITSDAINSFCSTGKTIVPLVEAIEIPPQERITYLQRLDINSHNKNLDVVNIVNSELPKSVVICLPSGCLVYLTDSDYQYEKFHFFETDKINTILDREIANAHLKLLNLSHDLWETYLEEMANQLINIHL